MYRQTPGMNRVNVSSHYFMYFYVLNLTPVQNECTRHINLVPSQDGADTDLKFGAQKRRKKFKGDPNFVLCPCKCGALRGHNITMGNKEAEK